MEDHRRIWNAMEGYGIPWNLKEISRIVWKVLEALVSRLELLTNAV